MATFTQNLTWLSTQIVSEELLGCLRFISASVLKRNQHNKSVTEIFQQWQERELLSQDNINILYETLTFMNQNKLRTEFLKRIGSPNFKPHVLVLPEFTRMLIGVRATIGEEDLPRLVFCYREDKSVEKYKDHVYALFQYLLDKILLTNDKESLNKFAGVLKVAGSIRGQICVQKYLKDNPNLPERAESQSTQEALSTVDSTQEDSDIKSKLGTYIKGNDNLIVIGAQNLSITQMTRGLEISQQKPVQSQDTTSNQRQAMNQQPAMDQQLLSGQSLAINQQVTDHRLSVGQQPVLNQQPAYQQQAMDEQSASARQLVMDNQPPTDQQSAIDQQSPSDQRPSTMQNSEQPKHVSFSEATGQDHGEHKLSRDRDSLDYGYSSPLLSPDTSTTEFSSPKPLVSLPPSSQSTSPTYKPTLSVQPGFQQGSWFEEKKCFRFSQNEIMEMKGEKIGEGGFGIVYKGKWMKECREVPIAVAIKEYNEEIAKGSKQGDEQFQKELSAVEISKHCFAVTVLGFCSDQKYKALVYPYMKKGDLKNLLDNRSPDLTWKIRLRILHQISRVMCHFHNSFGLRDGASIVHGDVKADNIFIDEHLNAFLGDFGVMEELPDGRTSITRNLQTNAMGYKDPDAVKQFSMSSDVYMFGVVIFRCITGQSAQQGKDPPECESLTSLRQGDIKENCGDLYERVDKVVWTTDQDEVVKELADLAINCFIRKRHKADKKRCTFKEIFKKLDALMKKEEIPGYEDNIDTRCICCQLHPLSRVGPNPECGCNSCMCLACLQKKGMPCPFHVSSEIKNKLTE